VYDGAARCLPDPRNVTEAFRLVAVGTRSEIRRALNGAGSRSVERGLLAAVLAQYEGDIDGAVRVLRHQLRRAPERDRPPLADVLAPILVMRGARDAVGELIAVLMRGGWNASAHAFRAILAAQAGDVHAARGSASETWATLPDDADEIVRFRVLQRLARAAFYLNDFHRAADLAAASARLCRALGAWRAAAASYSVIYNVHHNVTGDVAEADRWARLWHAAAERAEDESFLRAALVAEYELAVQLGDVPRTTVLQHAIRARGLPEQYAEHFALAYSLALARGATDPGAMRTLVFTLRETAGRTRNEWALCTALAGLADAARGDDHAARRAIRDATARLGRVTSADPAYQLRYRRLARAVAAATGFALGDDVRARRLVSVNECRLGHGEADLPHLMRQGRLDRAPAALTGIAAVLATAWAERRRSALPAGLTPAEQQVLELLALGWAAGRIATETGRSVNTIYNHTRAILAKLDASRAAEAVAHARARGILR
jgi:DNA-binding CsgD family transcriptional regulator